jgi:hypothetical protein
MLPLDRERSIKERKYKGVFDVRLSQGKIEHPTFLKKSHPNGCKTKLFGFVTIRANIHTCFVPLINVYKTSLSIFLFHCEVKNLFNVTHFYGTCFFIKVPVLYHEREIRGTG